MGNDAQDEIDAKKDKLFYELEMTLSQNGIKEENLYSIRWKIV